MKRIVLMMLMLVLLVMPVSAIDLEPPDVPDFGEEYMPEETESFGEGLWYIIRVAIKNFLPEIHASSGACLMILAVMILVSFLESFPETTSHVIHLASAVFVGIILLNPANTLIQHGVTTVMEMTEYGKLLIPVLTAALGAQGGVNTAATLFAITMFFCTMLSLLITKLIVPMLYIYFCLSLVHGALGDESLKNLRNFLKWLVTWCLKTILYVFTGFISVSGVVSGTADAAAVKAMKLTISGAVPVVGGIISDASETILISAGVMKSAAGVYGILAIIAVFIGPFLKIGTQYLLLKLTTGICGIFGSKQESELLGDFSTGMGMLLGMTGTVCLLLLISTVCFMKGVS